MSGATVVITDGGERAALAVVRSLGAAGYRCLVVSPHPHSLAGASRFAARDHRVADALTDPDTFARELITLARAERATMILPIAEASLLALLPRRAEFGACVIPFPDLETFRALSDKQRLLAEAATLGIHVPAQHVLATADLAGFNIEQLQFPVMLKPARSVGEIHGHREKLSVATAHDATGFRHHVRACSAAAFPLLVQQRIDGPGIGIFTLTWNGVVHAAFAHRRLTEKPPWGGVSVYREAVPMDESLLAQSLALLDRFHWYGVAMVEYKRDARTGRAYLMEINGRFWGSLQLAIDAGVDFPSLLASLALGGAVPSRTAYRVGVRSRWSWGQIDHVLTRLRHPSMQRTLPPSTVGLPRAIADVIAGPFRRHDYDEVFRVSDPAPFLRETLAWIRRT